MPGGLNWVDLCIIVSIAGAVYVSVRVGFVTQLCIAALFFGALFLFGWLFPHLLPISDRTLKTVLNMTLVLVAAGYAAVKGFVLGRYLHWRLRGPTVQAWERWLGIVPGIASSLVSVWLVAALLGWLPFAGLSNSVNDALIVRSLRQHLPPTPAVWATFNHRIDPNSPPRPFVPQPQPAPHFTFVPEEVQRAAAKAEPSLVRVTGFACGGLENGTGFAVGPNLVMTNAHVIAGMRRPVVKHRGHSYEAKPVVFNSRLDITILRIDTRVHRFDAAPLTLTDHPVAPGTTIAIPGYPGGHYAVAPGIVRNQLSLPAKTIYNFGTSKHNSYEIQTNVTFGNSGSPVVLPNGHVAGIIYAKYDQNDSYAAALAAHYLQNIVRQGIKAKQAVGTGACLAE